MHSRVGVVLWLAIFSQNRLPELVYKWHGWLPKLGLALHPVPFLHATSNLREQHHFGSGCVAPILFGWSRKLSELKSCSSLVVAFFASAEQHHSLPMSSTFDINPCPIGTWDRKHQSRNQKCRVSSLIVQSSWHTMAIHSGVFRLLASVVDHAIIPPDGQVKRRGPRGPPPFPRRHLFYCETLPPFFNRHHGSIEVKKALTV
jgi:hypothetical protein